MTYKKHKKEKHDPWHKQLVWIHTRIGFVTVLFLNVGLFSLFNFKRYIMNLILHGVAKSDMTLQNMTLLLESPMYVNCTAHPDLNENCKNITSAIRSAEIHELMELRTRVYDFIVYTIFMTVSLWLLSTVYRTSYEKTYFNALLHNCLLSYDLLDTLAELKTDYLRSHPPDLSLSIDKFVAKDEYGLHMFMKEELVFGKTRKFYELQESFEELMFRGNTNRPYFLFIHVIEWIHDLLRAVKMMHKKKLYHLDLQPKKIYLHWLQSTFKTDCLAWVEDQENPSCYKCVIKTIVDLDKYEYSEKRHIVLSDFDHAVRSDNGEVQVSRIGVPSYYRPPECSTLSVVNAAKVDAWCVGVVAYELLTGGMLAIRADRYPPGSTCEEIINDTLNKEFISTAMHAHYHLLNCFLDIRFIQKTFKNYDLDQTVFATDCWTFLNGLLRSSPEERLSIQQALRHPLMKRVRKQSGRVYYINYPL